MSSELVVVTEANYIELVKRTESLGEGVRERVANSFREIHGLVGCMTELGELADSYKRFMFYGRDLDRVNCVEEVGDILWYLAIVLDTIGGTFLQAMQKNIDKLRKRYPDKFNEVDAVVRRLGEERKALEGEVKIDQVVYPKDAFTKAELEDVTGLPFPIYVRLAARQGYMAHRQWQMEESAKIHPNDPIVADHVPVWTELGGFARGAWFAAAHAMFQTYLNDTKVNPPIGRGRLWLPSPDEPTHGPSPIGEAARELVELDYKGVEERIAEQMGLDPSDPYGELPTNMVRVNVPELGEVAYKTFVAAVKTGNEIRPQDLAIVSAFKFAFDIAASEVVRQVFAANPDIIQHGSVCFVHDWSGPKKVPASGWSHAMKFGVEPNKDWNAPTSFPGIYPSGGSVPRREEVANAEADESLKSRALAEGGLDALAVMGNVPPVNQTYGTECVVNAPRLRKEEKTTGNPIHLLPSDWSRQINREFLRGFIDGRNGQGYGGEEPEVFYVEGFRIGSLVDQEINRERSTVSNETYYGLHLTSEGAKEPPASPAVPPEGGSPASAPPA